jgi:hypothetical protein
MAIALSPETQLIIETKMKELGYANSDEFLQMAVCQYDPAETLYYEDLDEETRAAIELGQRQIDEGLGIPWEEAKARLEARFAKYRR